MRIPEYLTALAAKMQSTALKSTKLSQGVELQVPVQLRKDCVII